MLRFAESQNLTVQKDPSGIYYQIIEPGSGPSADLTSKIFITYKGQLLDGTTFDQQTDPTKTGWLLGPSSQSPGLIAGWQIGIPLIKKGGHIKMIIPSSLGYGCMGSPGIRQAIPPNEILYFDVTLTDIQ